MRRHALSQALLAADSISTKISISTANGHRWAWQALSCLLFVGLSWPVPAVAADPGEDLNAGDTPTRRGRSIEQRQRAGRQRAESLLEQAKYTGPARWSIGADFVDSLVFLNASQPLPPPAQWQLRSSTDDQPPERSRTLQRLRLADHMLPCSYSPIDTDPTRHMLRLTFWHAGQRIKLPGDAIHTLAGKTYADVELAQCPATLGEAIDKGYGPYFWGHYEAALARDRERREKQHLAAKAETTHRSVEKHEDAARDGLRFASQFYGDFDVTNTEAAREGQFLFDAEKLSSTEYGRLHFNADVAMVTKARSAVIEQEVQQLQSARQKLIYCKYAGDSLDQQIGARWIAANFWHKTRPEKISSELARWIEQANFPLVDVAVDQCPPYVGQFFALAQGTSSPRAKRLTQQAQAAALATDEPQRPACGKALNLPMDTNIPRPEQREPTEFEMCTAAYRYHNFEMTKKWGITLISFKKGRCDPAGLRYQCSYDISFTLGRTLAGSIAKANLPGSESEAGLFEWKDTRWFLDPDSTIGAKLTMKRMREHQECVSRHGGSSHFGSAGYRFCGPP
jgi:hypothetical protein